MKKILLSIGAFVILVAAGAYIDHRMKMDNSLDILKNPDTPEASLAVSATPQPGKPAATPEPVTLTAIGKAPEFAGISTWLNSDPLTIASLKGKVVLIDFWTYSCINCIRTLPYVTKWYDTYKGQGFVVIGVHTPEFDFEKDTGNVQDAIKRFNIHYPVAQDNSYGTWNAYSNQYWPAEYLIDKNGDVVYTHFGEGEYDHTENAIREALGMTASVMPDNGTDLSGIQSPEMYFGTSRLQYLVSSQSPSDDKVYTAPSTIPLNTFAMSGEWKFTPEVAQLVGGSGTITLKFHSSKVHMVASSPIAAKLTITVDGKVQPSITVKNSELYTLFNGAAAADHIIEIKVDQPGFQAFTFTFS